jgi:hypothetical protein
VKWKALAPLVLAALIALAPGPGRAQAIGGGTYRVTAGGNQDWGPSSGGIDQTSSDPLLVSGTMVGDENAVGTADYELASGPGIVRTKMRGSVTIPGGLFYPFNPSTQAVSTTELMISGPQVDLNSSLNVHVDGIVEDPLCVSQSSCGSLEVDVRAASGQTDFLTPFDVRDNSLGLAVDPLPGGGGVRVHGDVTVGPLGIRPNLPYPITLVVNLSSRFGASGSFSGDFDDPVKQFQVSFAPSGPVLNDIPAGYTVSGPNVVDNHWTDPFAPPSGDVVITSCAQLAQQTVVHVKLVIRNLTGCPTIVLPNLTRVDGDLIIEGTDASSIVIGPGTSIGGAIDVSGNGGDLTIDHSTVGGGIDVSGNGGDLTIDQSSVGGAIDVSGTSGDLTITDTGSTVVNVGNGQIGGDLTITDDGTTVVNADADVSGDLTITDNGSAIVNVGDGQTGGDLTIETGGDSFSATTAGGSTDVTILGGTAAMHAVLPAGAFDQPVSFTIARTADTPPEAGTAPDGSPAQVDPMLGFRFSFGIPTLNADAHLTFTVDLSQLDAAGRADLLNAIAAGTGTIAVKGDAPDAAFHAFSQCVNPQTPTADGCVAVTLLNAVGAPAGPSENPAFARFEGVAGHFSTYAVARVLALDTKAPTITAPAGVAADATGPTGARVTYTASAMDDHDASPTLSCSPASGSVFPIGDTTVVCNAKDVTGNASSARFVVHVRGAGEQIGRLIDKTVAFLDLPALKPSLKAALQSAADALVAKKPRAVCLALDVYTTAVRIATTRAFTPAERAELLADASRIKAVIGC